MKQDVSADHEQRNACRDPKEPVFDTRHTSVAPAVSHAASQSPCAVLPLGHRAGAGTPIQCTWDLLVDGVSVAMDETAREVSERQTCPAGACARRFEQQRPITALKGQSTPFKASLPALGHPQPARPPGPESASDAIRRRRLRPARWQPGDQSAGAKPIETLDPGAGCARARVSGSASCAGPRRRASPRLPAPRPRLPTTNPAPRER